MTDRNQKQAWEVFERTVRSIITRHRDFFELEHVEPGVTKVRGKSGYEWNVDIAGAKRGSHKTVIFEVRRRRKNVEPGEMAALAYQIEDTGSEKGYVVTKLDRGPSKGAEIIAGFEHIVHIQVAEDSTPEFYLMKCLKDWFVGITDSMGPYATDSVRVLVADKDGNVVRQIPEEDLNKGQIDGQND